MNLAANSQALRLLSSQSQGQNPPASLYNSSASTPQSSSLYSSLGGGFTPVSSSLGFSQSSSLGLTPPQPQQTGGMANMGFGNNNLGTMSSNVGPIGTGEAFLKDVCSL